MASSTATQFGYAAVAQSIDVVKNQVFIIQQTPDAEQVSAQRFNELQTELTAMKAQMKGVGVPLTESFRCEVDYNNCMGLALTWGRKVTCTLSFIACIGQQFTTLLDWGGG